MSKDILFDRVVRFMNEENITCKESIHQQDNVIKAAYGFIEDLYDIVEACIDKEDN